MQNEDGDRGGRGRLRWHGRDEVVCLESIGDVMRQALDALEDKSD